MSNPVSQYLQAKRHSLLKDIRQRSRKALILSQAWHGDLDELISSFREDPLSVLREFKQARGTREFHERLSQERMLLRTLLSSLGNETLGVSGRAKVLKSVCYSLILCARFLSQQALSHSNLSKSGALSTLLRQVNHLVQYFMSQNRLGQACSIIESALQLLYQLLNDVQSIQIRDFNQFMGLSIIYVSYVPFKVDLLASTLNFLLQKIQDRPRGEELMRSLFRNRSIVGKLIQHLYKAQDQEIDQILRLLVNLSYSHTRFSLYLCECTIRSKISFLLRQKNHHFKLVLTLISNLLYQNNQNCWLQVLNSGVIEQAISLSESDDQWARVLKQVLECVPRHILQQELERKSLRWIVERGEWLQEQGTCGSADMQIQKLF